MASSRGAGAAACGPGRAARRREPAGRPRSRPLPRLRPSPPGPTPPRRTPGPTPSPVGGARPGARRPPAAAAAVGATAASRPLGLLGRRCPLGWSVDSRARGPPRRPRLLDRLFPGPPRRSTLPRLSSACSEGRASRQRLRAARSRAPGCLAEAAAAAATRASSVTPCRRSGTQDGKGGSCSGDSGPCGGRHWSAWQWAALLAPLKPPHPRDHRRLYLPSVFSSVCWASGAVAADPCW